ncbi:type II toxin-antitoxin system VapC family toxin [Devosia nitrariae]|uniref:DNA-binding protein n=1 Tax=Devosia nitrariae TaxID=2071872 RepID=A0ABQ5W5K4_9HYPH|nr:type II toxin-antitoxin system VapC family toxin [Devosia nitrariae]GLQ55221.1 DNA-binding protein [Devosia nitrariae]
MILVDSNVVLDLVTRDPVWAEWSLAALEDVLAAGPAAINEIAFAELSVRYSQIEELESVLEGIGLRFSNIPKPALFLAGRVFGRYRSAGGKRESILPDFFIGAHAAVAGAPLLTRDVRRYKTYYPTLELIAPGTE